jgi:hypothetical protein
MQPVIVTFPSRCHTIAHRSRGHRRRSASRRRHSDRPQPRPTLGRPATRWAEREGRPRSPSWSTWIKTVRFGCVTIKSGTADRS